MPVGFLRWMRHKRLLRDNVRRTHGDRAKPTKEQQAERKARIEYNHKKEIANERERAIEFIFED